MFLFCWGWQKRKMVGDRFRELKLEGKCLKNIVAEVVKQESLRTNFTKIEVFYYIGKIVTSHLGPKVNMF